MTSRQKSDPVNRCVCIYRRTVVTNLITIHRRRSSVNFRGHQIFARKMCIKNQQNARILHDSCRKIIKIPEFLWYLPEKFTKFSNFTWFLGLTEIAGVENSAPSKLQRWKTREWKTRHQVAGVENTGVENAAPGDMGGKRGSGKRGTKFRGVFRIWT